VRAAPTLRDGAEVRIYRLGEEPVDDLTESTTVEERLDIS
jgi:hypothetical protein